MTRISAAETSYWRERERRKAAEDALRFYADHRNHMGVGVSLVYRDAGRRARAVIGECETCGGRGYCKTGLTIMDQDGPYEETVRCRACWGAGIQEAPASTREPTDRGGEMKYAPPREDGLKPWVVTVTAWARSHKQLEYAENAGQAEYQAKGRMRYTSARARRARPEDVAALTGGDST